MQITFFVIYCLKFSIVIHLINIKFERNKIEGTRPFFAPQL